ncbi:copper chaperone PCu(A)C [Leucobacter sp. UT-8R-CII-1-4]|uniref:copper chaperone PCu(A)C n=1 Tax=Leucobacter sp. UT-8R-CII-1-4 TaxID=3040075 RepID=UPI0024A82E43|nr:copper chaperone PCu(A)C [Leucobacter sp. UT-8R-CII-1-4]MDI6023067.1 copper chaperone PCu(A)C [Leucobacter sp. UT-8R-CII-1-4]
MRKFNTVLAAAFIVAPLTLLTACAPASTPVENTKTEQSTEQTSNEHLVMLNEGWAKAGETGGMTGVFGTLENMGDTDLTITGVKSDDAGMIELHEVTADGVMQEIQEDVVIPAKGSFELAPGANHIMLMDLKKDLLAGSEVAFTLELKGTDGKTVSIPFTVLVKDYAGANENYGGDESHAGH